MKVPTTQELQSILAAVPTRSPFGPRDRAVMVLLANTGLRVGELAGLDVRHVLFGNQLRDALTVPKTCAKGAVSRTIPLNANAQKAVRALLAFNQSRGFAINPTSPLVQDRFHRRVPVRSVQRMIQKYREIAGVCAVTPHTYRHFFATQALHGGTSTRTVQVLLGHWRLETVEIYTHHQIDHLKAGVRARATPT